MKNIPKSMGWNYAEEGMMIKTTTRIGLLTIYIFLPAIPLFLFFTSNTQPLTPLTGFALAAGITACVWVCLQIISGVRYKIFDRMAGLKNIYSLHRLMPLVIILTILIHSSLVEDFLTQKDYIMIFFGGGAYSIFLCLIGFSYIYFNTPWLDKVQKFEVLRRKIRRFLPLSFARILFIHGLLLVGAVFLLLHVMYLPVPGLLAFKSVMGGFFAVAFFSYYYHKKLRYLLLRQRPYLVHDVIQEAADVWTLFFRPSTGKRFAFKPGQFLYATLSVDPGREETHPFSISSAATNLETLSVTVKGVGDFTSAIGRVKKDGTALLDGPYGEFSFYNFPDERELVFIAGGIGITPFLSMLRTLQAEDSDRSVTLIWSAKHKGDLIRFQELEKLTGKMPNFVFVPILSRDTTWHGMSGRLDNDKLKTILQNVEQAGGENDGTGRQRQNEFFVCGPPAMIDATVVMLEKMGVKKRSIHSERFAA